MSTPAPSSPAAPASAAPAPSFVNQAPPAPAPAAPAAAAPAAPVTPSPAAATSQDSAAGDTSKDAQAPADTSKPSGEDGAEPFALKLPEGVEPDAKLLEGVTTWAKEAGVKQETAQKLADLYAQHQQQQLEAQQAALDAETKEWLATIDSDPELGGQRKPETLQALNRVMAAHGSPELRALMDSSGLGNHPAVVRFLARIGKAMGEDSLSGSTGGSNQQDVELHELLYGNRK